MVKRISSFLQQLRFYVLYIIVTLLQMLKMFASNCSQRYSRPVYRDKCCLTEQLNDGKNLNVLSLRRHDP